MPDDLYDDIQGDEGPDEPGWAKKLRKQFEAATKERDEARAELAAIRKDKVFDEAGIPADKAGALLRKVYDGELDTEAVKAAAIEYGIIEPPSPAPSAPAEELAAHERMSETASTPEIAPDILTQMQGAGSFAAAKAVLAQAGHLAE